MNAAELVNRANNDIILQRERIEQIALENQKRVLEAFREYRVSARHFAPTNGYGYDDIGRDTLDSVFARAMQCQSALVRPQIVNGSHAIFLAISGITKPNTKIMSITGLPYDTLQGAIGISGNNDSSLKAFGVDFDYIDLLESGEFDMDAITKALEDKSITVVYVQRSRGYSWRRALTIAQMQDCFSLIKSRRSDVKIFVDNCYGEFTETMEPTAAGANLMAGSLIKNPGGGIAPTGGYIAGDEELVEKVAYRLTVPGMGREVGSYSAGYRSFYQGLFMAPHTTAQCLLTATLFARIFELMGYETLPSWRDDRSDIIQAVKLSSADDMQKMCVAIQAAAPIDSFVVPEAWEMPGYDDKVIMAAGAFVQGATTELSADGPIREPYIVYMQGGLSYEHGKLAAEMVAKALNDRDA